MGIPFGGTADPGCRKAHGAGYVRGSAALAVICFITDFFGTLLTGLGLRSTDPNKKYKYYRVAIYSLGVAVVALFLAVIIYPTSMAKEMGEEPQLDGGRVQFKSTNDHDFDNDGIPDHIDNDDDNDGIPDALDNDTDGDGTVDALDSDDDDDGIADTEEVLDSDGDGTVDAVDNDDDNDGVPDNIDNDDDNDGIPDSEDLSGDDRVWGFGFGFGSAVFSLIFLLLSLIMLICDRESEEIFYKDREAEEEEGEEEKEEA